MNQTLVDMTGYARSELIGASAIDLLFSECREVAEQYIVRGGEEPYEITVRRRDGSTFRAEAKGKASTYMGRPARVGAISDVTTHKRMEETMRENEQQFRRALENAGGGVVIGDLDGAIQYANRTFLSLTGYDEQDVQTGTLRWDAITPAEHPGAKAGITAGTAAQRSHASS